ncbi:hypothetical protein LZ554_003534 [Drepanopeziza brunnea f. sp. 'monogermtubi']|nr:hypothetical protein LZ554_003534 [Drepanopeziza brunnea f. sp. 'monogermtubi']
MSASTTTATTTATAAPTAPTPARTPRESLIHNLSLASLIVCPIILALPPRRANLTTVLLAGGFLAGSNELAREYSGTSIMDRFGNRMANMTSRDLPPKALETQRRLREEKERRREEEGREGKGERERGREMERERRERGLLGKVWLGGEGEDWKAKRDAREKAALEEGKGYGGLIMDQIWEVVSWGKDRAEEVKEMDEKVVDEKKREGGKK